MEPHSTILLGLALLFGFYMAWNIGANDVANAMGTSVGSGALTLRRAVILAAILEFCGAYFAGANVSDTIRKGIVDPELFSAEPILFVCGMLAALLAAGAWLQIASYFGWPVSTTHSIVGAVIGFGIMFGGIQAIHWDKAGLIAASWIVSPVLSGVISYIIFRIILKHIFYKPRPVMAAKRFTPFIVFVLMTTLSLVLIVKGLKYKLDAFDLALWQSALIAAGVGIISAGLAAILVRRIPIPEDETAANAPDHLKEIYLQRALDKARKQLARVRNLGDQDMKDEASEMLLKVEKLSAQLERHEHATGNKASFQSVERIFLHLQVLAAAFIAFAHGSNDVANAIGPLAACWETIRSNFTEVTSSSTVPLWLLAFGGVGIVIGLATWGWRVMETIGRRITELTPTRGFCVQFGAALTIVLASVVGLPISTTHTLVGAVLGVGLARGIGALNMNVVRDVFVSWIVTIPIGAVMAMFFYTILKAIFA